MQGCYNAANTFQKMPQPCDNLTSSWQGCYTRTTYKFPYGLLEKSVVAIHTLAQCDPVDVYAIV